jgi:glycosyltransferase involved in cell wall biosynthesis
MRTQKYTDYNRRQRGDAIVIKVLHLISGGDIGGAKTHVLSLVNELSKSIPVKVICFMEGDFYEEGKAMGLDIEVFSQKRRYDLSVVAKLEALIRKEGYSIIHSHGARANFITRFLKGKVHIPCITTVHSDFMQDFKGNLYKHLIYTTLNIFALKAFDYYIAISDDFNKMLQERGFQKDRIFSVYNGIDFNEPIKCMDKIDFLKQKGLEAIADSVLVGMAARLHPVKGHKVLLEAAALALKEYPNMHFLLAGDGDEKENLIELAKKLDILDHVHFLGHIYPYDVYNSVDINVITSYTESFPYALLEGAKMHKASIASAVGGIPVLIKDDETGRLFDPGNSEDLANKLLDLANHEEKRRKLAEGLYEHAREHFSLEALAAQILEIYKKII